MFTPDCEKLWLSNTKTKDIQLNKQTKKILFVKEKANISYKSAKTDGQDGDQKQHYEMTDTWHSKSNSLV